MERCVDASPLPHEQCLADDHWLYVKPDGPRIELKPRGGDDSGLCSNVFNFMDAGAACRLEMGEDGPTKCVFYRRRDGRKFRRSEQSGE